MLLGICTDEFYVTMFYAAKEETAQALAIVGQEKKATSYLSVAVGVIVSIIGLTTAIVVWV